MALVPPHSLVVYAGMSLAGSMFDDVSVIDVVLDD